MANENHVPPPTNRGVENTCESALRACVDWLQVTFKNVQNPYEIPSILYMDFKSFTEFESGQYGYRKHIRNGNIAIYYDGQENMGCHLLMSGQGCREYEALNLLSWDKLFAMLLDFQNVNITRLDLAIDDFQGYFTVSQLIKKAKKGELSSKFKKGREITEFEIGNGETTGETLYFGKPSSMLQIRFYNKKQEREGKNKEVTVESWVRSELQLRDKRAKKAAEIIAFSPIELGNVISGILKQYLRFLIRNDKETNKSRWKTAKFWDKFLGDVEKIPLTMIAPDYTIDRAKKWTRKQVAPSLFAIMEATDWDISFFEDIFQEAKERLTDKHKNAIQQYRIAKKNRENIKHNKKIEGLKNGRFKIDKNGQVALKETILDEFDLYQLREKLKQKYEMFK